MMMMTPINVMCPCQIIITWVGIRRNGHDSRYDMLAKMNRNAIFSHLSWVSPYITQPFRKVCSNCVRRVYLLIAILTCQFSGMIVENGNKIFINVMSLQTNCMLTSNIAYNLLHEKEVPTNFHFHMPRQVTRETFITLHVSSLVTCLS